MLDLCVDQFEQADNMTERLTALAVLVNSGFEAERDKALELANGSEIHEESSRRRTLANSCDFPCDP